MNTESKKSKQIEKIFGKTTGDVLKNLYCLYGFSDQRIVNHFLSFGIQISLSQVWRLRKRCNIQSREQTKAHKIIGKTKKMILVETALGGQDISVFLPFLFAIPLSYKEILNFLRGYGVNLGARTLYQWLNDWGFKPIGIASKNLRRQKTSQRVKEFFLLHPEVKDRTSASMRLYLAQNPEVPKRHAERMRNFYNKNPNARHNISLASKKMWKRRIGEEIFCFIINSNIKLGVCQTMQNVDCADCPNYRKEK